MRKGGNRKRPPPARPKRGNVLAPQSHGLPPRRGMVAVERLTGTKCPKGSLAGTAKPCRQWIPATAPAWRGFHTPAPPRDIFGSVHDLLPCARDRHPKGRDPQGLGKPVCWRIEPGRHQAGAPGPQKPAKVSRAVATLFDYVAAGSGPSLVHGRQSLARAEAPNHPSCPTNIPNKQKFGSGGCIFHHSDVAPSGNLVHR